MRGLLAKLAAQRHTVLAGQHQVEDHEVETLAERQFEPLLAAVGEVETVAPILEILTDVGRDVGVVFDKQDFHRTAG